MTGYHVSGHRVRIIPWAAIPLTTSVIAAVLVAVVVAYSCLSALPAAADAPSDVPRDRMIWTAENYRSYEWLDNQSQVRIGLPYCTGYGCDGYGFQTVAEFEASLANGYQYSEGVDCSGFVTRVWEVEAYPWKLGTSHLASDAFSVPRSKWSMQKGDIYVSPSHVVVHFKYDAGNNYPYIYESTDAGYSGVRYYYDWDGQRSVSDPSYAGRSSKRVTNDLYTYLPLAKTYDGWTTIIRVANSLTDWREATVQYFNSAGLSIGSERREEFPNGYGIWIAPAGTDWVLVTSHSRYDQDSTPMSVVAELINDSRQESMAYAGLTNASEALYLPLAFHDWYGYNTDIKLLNIGHTSASGTIEYHKTYGWGSGTTTAFSLAPHQSTVLGGMSGQFVGSAVVRINLEYRDGYWTHMGQLLLVAHHRAEYSGFRTSLAMSGVNSEEGRRETRAPYVSRDWYGGGNGHGIALQNMGSRTATVRGVFRTFGAGGTPAGSYGPVDIAPGSMVIISADPDFPVGWPNGWAGTATFYSDNWVPLAMEVNMTRGSHTSAYEGQTIGSKRFVAPHVQNNWRWPYAIYYTVDGLALQNLENATNTIRIRWYDTWGTLTWGSAEVTLPALGGTAVAPAVPYDGDARIDLESLSGRRFAALVNMDSGAFLDPARAYVPTVPRADDIGLTP